MARKKVNPFAVCRAAGKHGRWPKKKVERCIRSVKRQLGAVLTSDDRHKAREHALEDCANAYPGKVNASARSFCGSGAYLGVEAMFELHQGKK